MIIKELRIVAFGNLENFKVTFKKGINIAFGENEKGKSTIETFIKVMLYGFGKRKVNGELERKRYLPFNGNTMRGELLLEHEGREYIIKRSFGTTKKEDSSIVLDSLSGEEIHEINNEEPGKSFLGINRVTFEKTLFVSQLGVAFTKDKEEEIMDKITALFGCGEEEVPIAKALEKLDIIKKELTTLRGVGTLDTLKKRESSLLEERYEGYRISEQNLQWENELYYEKEKRKTLNEEINNLDIYKKYLKKVNLQKEYKDISEYLRKSEELKKKEEFIQRDLSSEEGFIDELFLDRLKEDNRDYLNLVDRINELNLQEQSLKGGYNRLKKDIEEYKFLEVFGDNIKDKLIKVNYEQQNLKEKLTYMQRVQNEIESEEKELKNKATMIQGLVLLDKERDDIEYTFKEYERNLHEIKFIAEKNKINNNFSELIKTEKVKSIIGIILLILGVPLTLSSFPIKLVAMPLLILGGFILYKSRDKLKELNEQKRASRDIESLNFKIKGIEDKLDQYLYKFKLKNYGELLGVIRKYSIYKEYEEGVNIRILEKRKIISEGDFQGVKETINKNYLFLDKIIKYSNCSTIDEVVSKTETYDKLKIQLQNIESELDAKDKAREILSGSLLDKEQELKKKLNVMGLEVKELLDLEIYIKEYREKLIKYNEIKNNLRSIEETYKVLLKDRDIESIKKELKEIIREENPYTFKSEEEVEVEEKRKAKELIDCEKKIKDIQNNINTRLIGKRDIVSIEEELEEVLENIKRDNKKVAAIEMALNTLRASFSEIRGEVGPEINKRIGDNFEVLTNKKYTDVLLADNYEMMVRDENNIFKGTYLSNGALDQLYLSLRIAIIELIFKNEECPIILDDALIQYDDTRRKEALILLSKKLKEQAILFTCQRKEEEIIREERIQANFIDL